MKKLKLILSISTLTLLTSCSNLDVASVGTKLGGAALGYAIGNTQEDKFKQAGAVGAAAGALIGDYGYKKYKEKSEHKEQEAYLEGRAYERWGNAKKHWHTYTLDPHSGKPMAFKGLDFENGNDTSNSNSNSDYNTDPRTASEVKPAGTMVPVVVESGSYGGVDRTKRTLLFPKL